MDGRPEREWRLDALYVAVRDGAAVDRQVAFDVAMDELDYFPLHAEARELAEASVADGDESRLASAAAAFLDACGYEPGFEQAPERFARLERALDAVQADIRATGLTGEARLVRPDWTPNAVVETWAGDHGWTGGVFFSEAAGDLSALVAVAEQARQAVMESLGYQSTGRVWPACPAHGLGAWPRARDGVGVWWCDGGDGHVAAEIGHWPAWRQARLLRIPCLSAGITNHRSRDCWVELLRCPAGGRRCSGAGLCPRSRRSAPPGRQLTAPRQPGPARARAGRGRPPRGGPAGRRRPARAA